MKITKDLAAQKISDYLRHDLSEAELVDWAENALMDGEFEESQTEDLRTVVGRLGVADVRAFGLTWEDCEELLRLLGYKASIKVSSTS